MSTPPQRANIAWGLAKVAASQINIIFQIEQPNLIISAAPGILIDGINPGWTVIDQAPTLLAIETQSALPDTFGWSLPEWDPNVRTVLGGYLQPAQGAVEFPRATVATGTAPGGDIAELALSNYARFWQTSYLPSLGWQTAPPVLIRTGTQAGPPIWSAQKTVQLQFTGDTVEPGDAVNITDDATIFGTDGFFLSQGIYYLT